MAYDQRVSRTMKFPSKINNFKTESLHKDFSGRFQDILSPKVSQWAMNSFAHINTANVQIQEKLVKFSTNFQNFINHEASKVSFQNSDRLPEFWLYGNHFFLPWTVNINRNFCFRLLLSWHVWNRFQRVNFQFYVTKILNRMSRNWLLTIMHNYSTGIGTWLFHSSFIVKVLLNKY